MLLKDYEAADATDTANTTLTLRDADQATIAANHIVEVALDHTTLTATSDQIGYVVLNAGETVADLMKDH